MTTIAWRDGVLAADGRVTNGNLILTDDCRKIIRLSDGCLFALCGDDLLEQRIIEWLENCEEGLPPQGKDFTAILVSEDGAVEVYDGSGGFRPAYLYDGFGAWGSGSEVAYGALQVGATAKGAVVAASHFNIFTGGTIQTERPGLEKDTNEEPTT